MASVVTDRVAVSGRTLGARALELTTALHRYVGVVLALVFLAWFASGIVMMYVGYPLLGEADKLARAPALSVAGTVAPVSAWRSAGRGGAPDLVRLARLGERPVYLFFAAGQGWVTVAADDGEVLSPLSVAAAERVATAFAPGRGVPHYLGLNEQPDQWTLIALWAPYMAAYSFTPFHKFAFDDAAATQVSVLAGSGDVVQETTRSERLWGYLGAVIHWIYPTSLRRNAGLWVDVVVWTSALGAALCATGIVVGVLRYRWRREPRVAGSPFRGWLKWHHYLGLIFGLLASTWVFSGLMSMDPWDWSLTENAPAGSQHELMRGGALDLAAFTATPAAALAVCNSRLSTKELRLVQLRGEPYYWCVESPRASLLASGRAEQLGAPLERFSSAALVAAARSLQPGYAIAESVMLESYDSYYYPGWYEKVLEGVTKRLPVLRVTFDDPHRTAVYIDPYSGTPMLVHDTSGRWLRWLYHGLHSLDFGAFYRARPLWDGLVLPLMLGGVLLSLTSVWVAVKWLGRKWRGATRALRARTAG